MINDRAGIELAVEEFYEYARALIAARREDPRDDLISTLLAATYRPAQDDASGDGEPARATRASAGAEKLSEDECVNLVLNVLIGGVDTTQSQLAHAVRLLGEHPEQWRALVDDPSLAGAAVEEALRYEPITPFTARITVEDVEYRGVVFPKDTVVMVCAFTGNRDLDGESAGESGPDSFDIGVRRERARPLTFGAGVHYCLGANLARAELQEGLEFLARRLDGLELAGEPAYEGVSGIYGLSSLPVRFTLHS
jgi:cytochrome P450